MQSEDTDIVEKIKKRIRAKSETANEEVEDLINACKKELEMKGVHGDETDPMYYQAIVLYCKAHYGYDEDSERFEKAYNSLRDSMYLSGNYEKKEGGEN